MEHVGGLAVLVVFCLVAMGLLMWALSANNAKHHAETGVNAPNRAALKRIRRNARQKGISQEAAYNQWVQNKQRRKKS